MSKTGNTIGYWGTGSPDDNPNFCDIPDASNRYNLTIKARICSLAFKINL